MSTKFTCRFCKEEFDVPKGLYKHLQLAHNSGVSRDNRTCPICGVLCSKYEGYRDHLLYIHGQADDGQMLTFKSLNELMVWKSELELKHNCKYILQTSPKVLPTKEKKYFYQCDRSDSKSKDKKSLSVVMKTCPSVISVVEGTGLFKVEYWDTHSGHSEASTVQAVQKELEAAISSVEMVNAIAGSDDDDSFDKSEDMLMSDSSSPISNSEKQGFVLKTNSPPNTNSFNSSSSANASKTKSAPSSVKFEGPKKKNTHTSILFSLASVACGKGITKKTAGKSNESKDDDSVLTPETELNSKNACEKSSESSLSTSEEHKDDLKANTSTSEVSPTTESSVKSPLTTTTTASSISSSLASKISSGLPAIAPKITTATTNNSINPLFTSNSNFSNQLVIVNPVGMDQNALNSNQNVFSAGQNILLSLGSLGQNAVPANTPPSVSAAGENKTASTVSTKGAKAITSVKSNTSIIPTTSAKSSLTVSKSTSNSCTTTVTSSSASSVPITLTTGLNNAPVILSSLPVGSTFMSVNNSLIPIATPTGTLLPSNLPPNIVLAPVMPGTNLPSLDSSLKTTFSSTSSVSALPPSIQTQVRYTAPTTAAVTVSSIVKEPVYTTSANKHMSSISASTSSLVSPSLKNSLKNYSKNKTQNKFVPITMSGSVSPLKNAGKFTTSTPIKSNLNSKTGKYSSNSVAGKIEAHPLIGKLRNNVPDSKANSVSNRYSLGTLMPSVTSSSVSIPKASARKRISKNTGKSKLTASPLKSTIASTIPVISAPINTKVVNAQLDLAPISSAPNVTIAPHQLNAHKPGTFLFESSGEIYMLEPVENDSVENVPSVKSIPRLDTSKIKIDRSVQTNESSSLSAFKSKLRKRAAPPTDDSAVMLKVKCYQLEMKYLNVQTECKRLKVELTKEKLKNAELMGEKAPHIEEDGTADTSRCKAAEIMKEIEDRFNENKDVNIYTMTKTSVLRSLYEDLEELCTENSDLHKELENYRTHDKFYKSLKKKLYDEEF